MQSRWLLGSTSQQPHNKEATEEACKGRTAAAKGALGAQPLAVGDRLGALADAAHVVRCRAAVAAQQVAAQAAQSAGVQVAIIRLLVRRLWIIEQREI